MIDLLSAPTSKVLRSAQLRAKLAEVWALSFGMIICENCDHEVIEFHERLKEMAKKKESKNPNRGKRYLLKKGYFVSIGGRQVNRDTMTDEDAERYLKHYPTAEKFFDLVDDAEPESVAEDFVFPDDLDNIGE